MFPFEIFLHLLNIYFTISIRFDLYLLVNHCYFATRLVTDAVLLKIVVVKKAKK
jgi:hypothetical protein